MKIFAEKWINHQKATTERSSWTGEVSNVNKYIIPAFGAQKLRSFDLYAVQKWLDELKGKVSDAKRNALIRCMKQIFTDAAAWGRISANPLTGLDRIEVMKREVEIYSSDELATLFAWLLDHKSDQSDVAELAVNTGMRLGEIFGLTWNDIDLVSKTARVQTIYCNKTKTLVPRTKGKKARRVPLNGSCIEILTRVRLRGLAAQSNQVFGHCRYEDITEHWVSWLESAGLTDAVQRGCTFHNLRHTFAGDFMRRKAGTIYELQQILGHSTYKTTEDNYLRFRDEDVIGKTEGVGYLVKRQSAKIVAIS